MWEGRIAKTAGWALRSLAAAEFGRRIVSLARQNDATLFLAFKGTFVPAETIRELRRHGVLTICHYPDVSTTAHGAWLRESLREYDWVFTTKTFGIVDMAREVGVTRSSVVLHGFDPEVHRPLALSELDYSRYQADVSFIGTWLPAKERQLDALRRALPHVRLRVWGNQWNRSRSKSLEPFIEHRPVEGRAYAAAIQSSAVNLALLSERIPGASRGDQITSRTFHIPASGGLMLHQHSEEYLEKFEDGLEALSFADDDEMCDQISRVLDDSAAARAIQTAGTLRVWGRDSWDHRMAEMLEHAVFDRLR
jgi:spore maturation protein CgeB